MSKYYDCRTVPTDRHSAIPLQIDNKKYVFLFFMANEEYKNLRELLQFLLHFVFLISLWGVFIRNLKLNTNGFT